jgi:hypothetical protein
MEDASLDEFLDAGNSGTDGVEPAAATFEWSPAGADCESCGIEVWRRWNSGAGLVCAECKEW